MYIIKYPHILLMNQIHAILRLILVTKVLKYKVVSHFFMGVVRVTEVTKIVFLFVFVTSQKTDIFVL